jgi:RHS repeat-associated protein
MDDAIAYALDSPSGQTGLYASLSCYYATASSSTIVSALSGLGGFKVQGASCSDLGTVNELGRDGSSQFQDLSDDNLFAWNCPVEETCDSWPSAYSVVALDRTATPVEFTAPDGLAGQPYVLVNNVSSVGAFYGGSGAIGGAVPISATYGGANPAAPATTNDQAYVADAISAEDGDFTESNADFSIPTEGPALDLRRTFDSRLAQAEAATGTPGPFGYGWTDNFAQSANTDEPVPGDMYSLDGTRTAAPNGSSKLSTPIIPMQDYWSGGNLYIADSIDNRIEEIPNTTGTQWGIAMTAFDVYTIAGSATGVAGHSGDGGKGYNALLSGPSSVVIDESGDLYIADSGNNRVQVVSPDGTIETFAGSPNDTSGCSGNGTPTGSSLLDSPEAVAVGFQNNDVYIGDTLNNRVVEVPAATGSQWSISMTAAKIYTIAGNVNCSAGNTGDGGLGKNAYLDGPTGIAMSSADNLYIADTYNNRIRELSSSNSDITNFAGQSSGAAGHANGNAHTATSAYLNLPMQVDLDNGQQVYVDDYGNNRIEEVAHSAHTEWGVSMTAGDIYTIAGNTNGVSGSTGDGGNAAQAYLDGPEGVCLDGSFNLDIADTFNGLVRQVNASTADISTYAGTSGNLWTVGNGGPAPLAGLSGPSAVITDQAGNVYIADSGNNRVQEIAANNHTQWGISMTAGDVYTIAGAADGHSGNLGDGTLGTSALLNDPTALAISTGGYLYIADSGNNRVRWLSPATAKIWAFAGNGTVGDSGTGAAATSAELDWPDGLAVDAAGDVYIADGSNDQIREVFHTGGDSWGQSMSASDIYTIAGSSSGVAGDTGNGGAATSALLYGPSGLTLDSAGDLYIADTDNHRIQELANETGTQWGQSMAQEDIYTVAGQWNDVSGSGGMSPPGPATSADLYYPGGVALDSVGDLYISDTYNSRIDEVPVSTGYEWGQQMTAGDIYVVAGSSSATAGFQGDGQPATSGLLNYPSAAAIDPSGNLLIADTNNGRLREATTSASSLYLMNPTPSGITINQGTGSEVTFFPQSSGNCTYLGNGYQTAGSYCTLQSDLATLSYNATSKTYAFIPTPSETDTFNVPPAGSNVGNLVSESDAAEDTLTISYGAPSPGQGQCPSTAVSCNTVTSASGRALILATNSSGEVTSVTDPMGRSWTYSYDSSGNLTSAIDPMSNVTSYTYDTTNTNPLYVHDVLTITKPNGQSGGPDAGAHTTNTYDTSGRVLTQTDPAGWETVFNYRAMDSITGDGQVIVLDPDDNQTAYEYTSGILNEKFVGYDPSSSQPPPSDTIYSPNAASLLDQTVTNPDGATMTYAYDSSWNLTSSIGPPTTAAPSGAETSSAFTSLEQPNCTTTALAAETCASSNVSPPSTTPPGEPISAPSSTTPLGVNYTEYDTNGNELWSSTGVYEPGATSAMYEITTYQLFSGNTLKLGSDATIQCTATPPLPSLPCATVDADGVVTEFAYDSYGDLTSKTTGLVPTLSGLSSSASATTTYTYDADGEATSTVSPDGNVSGANAGNYTTLTTYNADGDVTSTSEGDGSGHTVTPRQTSYGYDGNGNETSITDPLNNTTTLEYSADDEQTFVTDADGDSGLTCYDGDGHATETVPAVGVAAGSLTPASCPTAYPSGYGDRLASDASTASWNDAQGEVLATSSPAPAGESGYESSSYLYDSGGNTLETIEPPTTNGGNNAVTVQLFDNAGELTSKTSAYGTSSAATGTYCYDPAGNQTAAVPPDGNINGLATCENSAPWVVSSTAFPTQAAYESTATYDSVGEATSTTSPAASGSGEATTTTFRDPDGHQLAVTEPEGNAGSCDPINPTSYTDPFSLQTSSCSYTNYSTYSPTGHVLSSTDALGNATTYTYDAAGNRLTTTDPMSNTTTNTYDSFGKLASTESASGTTSYFYNADGRNVAVTGPGGNPATCNPVNTPSCAYTTYSSYDAAGRLLETTNPDGQITADYYDQNGDILAVTGGSGNPYSVANPSGCNPTTTSTCADSTYYQYDNNGKLAHVTYTDGTAPVSYAYAPDGHACWMYSGTSTNSCASPPTGSTTYGYDAGGNLISSTNAAGATMTYAYDASSNVTCMSYPNAAGNTCNSAGNPSGIVRFGYDFAGQVQSITDWVGDSLSITHGADGELCWLSNYAPSSPSCGAPPQESGHVTMAWSYDGDSKLSGVDVTTGSSPSTLLDIAVTARTHDELISQESATVGTTTMPTDNYTYTGANQVASGPIVGTSGSDTYAYTSEGAITKDTTLFGAGAYDYTGAACWTYSGTSSASCSSPPNGATTYSTNTDGERTSMVPASGNPTTYGWNTASGDLACVNTAGASCSINNPTPTTTVYTYDGQGLRTSATIGSTTTTYTWAPQSEELASDGSWDFIYLPGTSVPIEQIAASGSSAADLLVADPNNSVRGIVQLSGGTEQNELVNYTDYDAFGNPLTASGGVTEAGGLTTSQTSLNAAWIGSTPFGFGGGYTDATGLVYLVHRYYDPSTGQFMSIDPVVDLTQQPYLYGADDPVNATDPSGQWIVYWPTATISWENEFAARDALSTWLNDDTGGNNGNATEVLVDIPSDIWNIHFGGAIHPLGNRIVDVYNYGVNAADEVKLGRQGLDGVNCQNPYCYASNWAQLVKDYFMVSYQGFLQTNKLGDRKVFVGTWFIFPNGKNDWGAVTTFLWQTLSLAPRFQINAVILAPLPETQWYEELLRYKGAADLDQTQNSCDAYDLVPDSYRVLREVTGWTGLSYPMESSPNPTQWYGGCAGAQKAPPGWPKVN